MRFLVVPSLLGAVIVAAACGGSGDDEASTVLTDTGAATGTLPTESPQVLTLYFLRDGKVAPVARHVTSGSEPAETALAEVVAGPGPDDEDVESAIDETATVGSVEIDGDLAIISVTPEPTQAPARAQIVYTLTSIPEVKRVSFGGADPVGRGAFENQTPAVLVESPLPGQEVESGFEVTGTANTFEATFNYELKDASGEILKKDFVTATSGSGTRGTFRFTVPYEVDEPQDGTLVVFEISAEDGSRTNESEIPLRLE